MEGLGSFFGGGRRGDRKRGRVGVGYGLYIPCWWLSDYILFRLAALIYLDE
jgi:hypothetical protein